MVGLISTFSKIVAGVGIFLGFYYLSNNPLASLGIVTITTVGIVGMLAFIRHFIFHKQDAARMGWETDRPDWMFEVGFANLAFGFMGILAVAANWGKYSQILILLGFSLYLFQAALLHSYRYFTDDKKSSNRLWKSVIPTLVLVAMMTFFAVYSI